MDTSLLADIIKACFAGAIGIGLWYLREERAFRIALTKRLEALEDWRKVKDARTELWRELGKPERREFGKPERELMDTDFR